MGGDVQDLRHDPSSEQALAFIETLKCCMKFAFVLNQQQKLPGAEKKKK